MELYTLLANLYGVGKKERYGYSWGIDAIMNWIGMGITKLLAFLLKVAQALVEACWDFLQYSSFGTNDKADIVNTTEASNFYSTFTKWLWIPIAIVFLFFLVKMLFLDRKSDDIKRFTTNIGTLIAVALFLPTIFIHVNTEIFGSGKSRLLSIDSESISSKIFFQNTLDFRYISENMGELCKELEQDTTDGKFDQESINTISDLIKTKPELYAYLTQDRFGEPSLYYEDANENKYYGYKNRYDEYSRKKDKNGENVTKDDVIQNLLLLKSLDDIDINEPLIEDDGGFLWWTNKEKKISDKAKDAFQTFVDKIIQESDLSKTHDTEKQHAIVLDAILDNPKDLIDSLSDAVGGEDKIYEDMGELFFGATKQQFFRYRANFLSIWIELIANIYLFFCASYAILKIIWELVIIRIFGSTLTAMDLSGGEKAKKMLTTVLGLYVSLLFVSITLILYNDAVSFVHTARIGGSNEFIQALLIMMLASIAVDGPNMVAKYFGVETGMRGGAQILTRGIQNGIRYGQMARMTHSMHKQNAARARQTASNSFLGKVFHPIGTGENAVSGKVNKAANHLKNSGKANKDLLKEQDKISGLEEKLKNATQSASTRNDYKNELFGAFDKKPESVDDYKNAITKDMKANGIPETEENNDRIIEAAEKMRADDLINNDSIANAGAEEILTGYDAEENIKDQLIDNGISDNFAQQIAHEKVAPHAKDITRRADKIYSEVGKYGKETFASQKVYDTLNGTETKPYEAYERAAKSYLANNGYKDASNDPDVIDRIASRAYGEANRDSLRAHTETQIRIGANQDANRESVLRESLISNGWTENQAQNIAAQAMRNNTYYETNKEAGNLPGSGF